MNNARLADWFAMTYSVDNSYQVTTMTALRALQPPKRNFIAIMQGYNFVSDGGEGVFIWAPYSTASDDNGVVIQPYSLPKIGRWIRHYKKAINILWYGAKGDGISNDSNAVQSCIYNNAGNPILFPSDYVFNLCNVFLPSNTKLIIDGTVQLPPKSADGSVIFKNLDQINGNKSISIIGMGTLDGNKTNQVGRSTKHHLVDMCRCEHFEFAVKNVKGNYFPRSLPSTDTTGAIYIKNSKFVDIHDVTGSDYGRECFWLFQCNYSKARNLKVHGGMDSWSGLQFQGNHNEAINILSKDAGASGISFDCCYSVISNCCAIGNTFFHGFNFGHKGYPANYTSVISCQSFGAAENGFNIVSRSDNITLMDCKSFNAKRHAFNVSDSANRVKLLRCLGKGARGYGINIYGAKVSTILCDFNNNREGAIKILLDK